MAPIAMLVLDLPAMGPMNDTPELLGTSGDIMGCNLSNQQSLGEKCNKCIYLLVDLS